MAKNIYVGVNNVARKVTKAYVGVNYKPVEYLESTGTQYIDTGLNLYVTQGSHIEASVEFTNLNGNIQAISGSWLSDADRATVRVNADNKLVTHFRSYQGDNLIEGPVISQNQHYTIEARLFSGSQFLKVNGTTYGTKSVTGTFTNDINLYLLGINARFVGEQMAICKVYYVKFYDSNGNLIRDYIPVLDKNNIPCLLDKVEGKPYYNIGTGDFLYGSRTAEPEVSGPREIKKAYVGVNGVARLFYKRGPTYITFTRSPAPTGWVGSGTAAGSTRTAVNSWGLWTIRNVDAASSSYPVERGFDHDDATYTRANTMAGAFAVKLYCPTDIKIKPTKYRARVNQIQANSQFNGNNGSWVTLQTNTSQYSTTTTITPSVSTNNYYSIFEFKTTGRSSNYSTIHDFKITDGIIEDSR